MSCAGKIAKELDLEPVLITPARAPLELLDEIKIDSIDNDPTYARASHHGDKHSVHFNTQYAGALSDDVLLWVLGHEFGHILFRTDMQSLFDWRLGTPLNLALLHSR